MESDLYESLLGADVELAWSLVGPQVVRGLLGNDAIAVSSLEQAAVFDLLAIFVKKVRPRSVKVTLQKDRFKLLGSLPDLCSPAPDGSRVTRAPPQRWAWFQSPYRLNMVSWGEKNQPKTQPKEIHVRVQGVRKLSVQLTFRKGDLTLVPWLYGLQRERHVYVITDVFRADDVSLEVSVGGRTDRLVCQQLPLAFKWKKYRMSRSRPGLLKELWIPISLRRYEKAEFLLCQTHGHRQREDRNLGDRAEREAGPRNAGHRAERTDPRKTFSESRLLTEDSSKWAVRLAKSAGNLPAGSTSAGASMRSGQGHDLRLEDMEVENVTVE